MHTRTFRALGAVGAVGASLALAAPAFAATTPTLYVNGNGGTDGTNTCRLSTNPCATIQHAINEAPTTANISVAAGTYTQQLTITNKNLTITGAGQGSTIIQPSSPLNITQNDPTHMGTDQADLVTFSGAKSGGLDDLTVDGAEATETDGGTNYVGVFMLNSAGTLSSVTISNVQHDQNTFGDQAGANGGVLVANSDGKAHTVKMSSLDVFNYDKNGITCRSKGTTCTISSSTVTGIGSTDAIAQNGIELYGITAGTVTNTAVTDNTYANTDTSSPTNAAGVLVINVGKLSLSDNNVNNNDVNIDALEDQADFTTGPAQGAWAITGNTVTGATNTGDVPLGEGIGDGLDIYGASKVTVYGNTVSSNADWGIALFGAKDSKIGGSATGDGNTVDSNGDDGIFLAEYAAGKPSTGDSVSSNDVEYNGDDGILASGKDSAGHQQSTANKFLDNTLVTNTRYDAEDLSTGSKTAHTADTWTGNSCTPAGDSVPGALCP